MPHALESVVRNVEILLEEHGDLDILQDFQASWAVVRAGALLLRRHREVAENRALTAALESMCRAAPLSGQVHVEEITRMQELLAALEEEHGALIASVEALEGVVGTNGRGEDASVIE